MFLDLLIRFERSALSAMRYASFALPILIFIGQCISFSAPGRPQAP